MPGSRGGKTTIAMAEERIQRRLAAILAADVVGYSRLMETDEAGTLNALRAWQRDILHPLVAGHGGRVVKLMGDGVLAEFASAVNAVECAVALQAAMAAPNRALPPDRRVLLRIGINLGDVLVEGDDLYGDGVNLAARIEALAEPGAVNLSQAVFEQVQGKVDIAFEDTGEHSLKNIARPMRIYRAIGPSLPAPPGEPAPVGAEKTMAPLTPSPAIAVLPFISMGGEAEQGYLADGVTEDIITELSRFTSLTVIARNSSFRFRDQPVDVKQVGRKLGARYVVEGSLRRIGDRIRITAQLIEVETGGHLWAERYDRTIAELPAAQDKVVQAIVTALSNRVAEYEEEQGRRRPAAGRTAYDLILQARHAMQDGIFLNAEAPLRRAIELDPELSEAHALLVYALLHKYFYGDDDGDLEAAAHSARRAIALNSRGSGPQFSMAGVAAIQGNYALAGSCYERAIALNPNNVVALIGRAQWLLWGGRVEEALAALEASVQHEALAHSYYWEVRGEVLYQQHRYPESIDAFGRMNQPHFWIKALVVAGLAQSERLEEARRHLAALREAVPNVTIARVLKAVVYQDDACRQHLLEGLRKAGMPA
jgi:adenylate cyclase